VNAKSRERIVMLIVVTLVFSITLIYFVGCLLDSEYYNKKAKEIEFSELYLGSLKIIKEIDTCIQEGNTIKYCNNFHSLKDDDSSVFLVTDKTSILAINFDAKITILLRFDPSQSKWHCFGWPEDSISQKECIFIG